MGYRPSVPSPYTSCLTQTQGHSRDQPPPVERNGIWWLAILKWDQTAIIKYCVFFNKNAGFLAILTTLLLKDLVFQAKGICPKIWAGCLWSEQGSRKLDSRRTAESAGLPPALCFPWLRFLPHQVHTCTAEAPDQFHRAPSGSPKTNQQKLATPGVGHRQAPRCLTIHWEDSSEIAAAYRGGGRVYIEISNLMNLFGKSEFAVWGASLFRDRLREHSAGAACVLNSRGRHLAVQLDSAGSVVSSQSHSPHNWHFPWWLGEPQTRIPKLCFGGQILKGRGKGSHEANCFFAPRNLCPSVLRPLRASASRMVPQKAASWDKRTREDFLPCCRKLSGS